MIKKSLKTERIYVHKGKSRTGHLDSCGLPTQGKLKNSKHVQEKKKLIDMKNLLDVKKEIKL